MKLKRSMGLWTATALIRDTIVAVLLCGIPVYVAMRWWDRRKLEHVTIPEPEKVVAGAR